MSGGFTDKEIADELNRRWRAQEQIEEDRREVRRRQIDERADADCVHCGQPFQMSIASGGEFGFCDECAPDD